MSKNDVVITGVVEPDPDEPTLPDEEHRGAVNEAKDESLLEQASKQSLPEDEAPSRVKPQSTKVAGEVNREEEGPKKHGPKNYAGSAKARGRGRASSRRERQ